MKLIPLNITFLSNVTSILPRKRNATRNIVTCNMDVNLRSFEEGELPAAYELVDCVSGEKKSILYFDNKFWEKASFSTATSSRDVTLEEVIQNTETHGKSYRYSCSSAAAPFNDLWYGYSFDEIRAYPVDVNALDFASYPKYEDFKASGLKGVERNAAEMAFGFIEGIAASVIYVGGIGYKECNEHIYALNPDPDMLSVSIVQQPEMALLGHYFGALQANEIDRLCELNIGKKPLFNKKINVLMPEKMTFKGAKLNDLFHFGLNSTRLSRIIGELHPDNFSPSAILRIKNNVAEIEASLEKNKQAFIAMNPEKASQLALWPAQMFTDGREADDLRYWQTMLAIIEMYAD